MNKRCLSRACFGLLAIAFIKIFAPVAEAGFIADWSGNGNANDSAGGHNGTLINGAGFGAGQFGQQAFQLDGVSQYISVPDSPALDLGSSPFTIALWANFSSISSSGISSGGNLFIGQDDGGGSQNKWFFSYTSDGSLGFHINGPSVGGVFLTSPSQMPVNTGEWNLFAITRDGNNYTFYENGALLGSVIDSRTIPDPIADLTIGQAENIGYFAGRLQNVQIYDQALTADQISQLADPSAVPEPSVLVMLSSLALTVFGACSLRKRSKKSVEAA